MNGHRMQLFTDLIRFWLVGAISVAVHFLALVGCVERLEFNPTLSSALSFVIASLVNYLLLYYWAFLSDGKHRIVVIKYIVVMTLTMSLNVFIFWVLTEKIGLWYVFSQAIATLSSSLFSFLFNRNYTFV